MRVVYTTCTIQYLFGKTVVLEQRALQIYNSVFVRLTLLPHVVMATSRCLSKDTAEAAHQLLQTQKISGLPSDGSQISAIDGH